MYSTVHVDEFDAGFPALPEDHHWGVKLNICSSARLPRAAVAAVCFVLAFILFSCSSPNAHSLDRGRVQV